LHVTTTQATLDQNGARETRNWGCIREEGLKVMVYNLLLLLLFIDYFNP